MKKILYSVMALAIAAMTFTACEDVPAPYDIPTGGGTGGGGSLPYASANLNTGWSLVEITAGAQPWSKGSSYAQATGYQKWDGASTKSNKAVEGWLVSPAISTVGYENVKLSFNNTIKYTNNVSGWEANHKVYASTDFNGSTATWKELDFVPVASPYASSDWTLYSSGEIQLPAEFVGKEKVYIGFWFKAPANASTTWELQSFKMEEGIAQTTPPTPPTPTEDLGTAENPITVAKALETINGYAEGKESSTEAYVKGVIVSVENYNSQYKSITYYISDDGTENGKLQVYSGKGLNGADFAAKTDLNKGAIVVVKGKLKKYVKDSNVTPEINQSSQIISIENNGGGDTPAPTVVGSIDNPVSVATALTAINALSDGATSTEWYYIKGKVKSVKTAADKIAQYKNIDYFITDDGNNELQIFRGKNLNNTDFTSADQLKVDDEVIVYGQLMKYKNSSTGAIVPEVAEGNYLVKTSNTGGGGTEPGGGGGEVSGNAISVNFSSLGLSNQEKVSTLTLSDGTTLTFDGGGNSNSPAYYNTGTALRMYPKNTMTINAGSKKIAAIEIECNEYSGTVYNASGDITVNNTKMTIDGLNLKFAGPNASTANVANASTTTGAPSQLRMMTLKITYAE